MPEMDGIEVCRRVREADRKPYTYLILHTTKNMQIGEAMESGADDYLTLSVSQYQLRARLRVARRLLELEDELRAAREALHTQAAYDPLTRLWNQAAVMDLLVLAISQRRLI
jgi:two-component system chemotaxis response regulator CheY